MTEKQREKCAIMLSAEARKWIIGKFAVTQRIEGGQSRELQMEIYHWMKDHGLFEELNGE